ncbi:hypothetical protein Dimus_024419 [Dionaea muscipula]
MKQPQGDFPLDMEKHGSMSAMNLDDSEPLDPFGNGLMHSNNHKLVDSDFFNSFEDDFDDFDIKFSLRSWPPPSSSSFTLGLRHEI